MRSHRIAYAVIDAEASSEKKSRWRDIGVTFRNKDGSETVLLDAVPLSGKVVLRDPPEQEESRGIAVGEGV